MEQKKILIIEDEKEIREGIKLLLSCEEFVFTDAENGLQGLQKMSDDIDLVILDIMMPELDGLAVCKEIRKKYTVPILFLTAKALEADKLIGLHCGADDYLTKPFSYIELHARIKSLLRRYCVYRGVDAVGAEPETEYIEIDDIMISRIRNDVLINGKEVNLTETEYQLLLRLMKKPNRSQSAKILYEDIWNEPFFYGAANTVMVHIKNLRAKIETDKLQPEHIITVWGKGYQFRKLVDE